MTRTKTLELIFIQNHFPSSFLCIFKLTQKPNLVVFSFCSCFCKTQTTHKTKNQSLCLCFSYFLVLTHSVLSPKAKKIQNPDWLKIKKRWKAPLKSISIQHWSLTSPSSPFISFISFNFLFSFKLIFFFCLCTN